MILTLELQPEEVVILEARAKALGVNLDALVHRLIAQIAAEERPLYETASLDEWEMALDQLSDDMDPTIPPLSDDALRRENLYADRGQ